MNEICEKCKSDKIIPQAKVIDRGHGNGEMNLMVSVDEDPNAYFFKQRIRSEISAKVCGNCGFIELYTKDYEVLYNAYKNQQDNSKD